MQTLKEFREARGIAPAVVADYLGITPRAYARYEEHPELLTVAQALLICKYLGYEFDSLCA